MDARYPGHGHFHAVEVAMTGVDNSGIGEELASFWEEVQYRALAYWTETEYVQSVTGLVEADAEEAVLHQRMAWHACRDLLLRAPRSPYTGIGSPAVIVHWQACSILSLIHTNEGYIVPFSVWNGIGPGLADEVDDRA
jgi:hypothetical protein